MRIKANITTPGDKIVAQGISLGLANVTNESKETMFTDPAFTGSATAENLTISGNLQVNGISTTVNQTNLDISDNIIGLNRGATNNQNDSGLIVERGGAGDNAAIIWDETADKFALGTTTNTPSSIGDIGITTGTLVANIEGNVTATDVAAGTLTTQSITGETRVGTPPPLVIEGGTTTNVGALGGGTLVLEGGESPNNTAYHGSIVIGPEHTGSINIGRKAVTTTQVSGGFKVNSDTTFNPETFIVDPANDRVGINVSAPTSSLHVKGASGGNTIRQIRIHNDSATGDTGSGIAFTNSASETYVNASIDSVTTHMSGSGNLVFSTRADSSASDDNATVARMTINDTGEIGIGKVPERTLDMDGHFRLLISPENRIANQSTALIKGTGGRAANLRVVGPVTVTHDLFKNSGDTGGFADNSNHFHDITRINRITQQGAGDVLNIERVQEQYYAIQSNNIKNDKAAFWNWHRVTRSINTTPVSLTNLVGWDISDIQSSGNRQENSQALFPAGGAEDTTFTFSSGNNPFSLDALLRITIEIDFEGAIVAASLFAKVTGISGDEATVVLYGGNYKSINEVSLGTSQDAVTENFSVEEIDISQSIPMSSSANISVLSDPTRKANIDDTFFISFTSDHGLELNDVVTILTDGATSHGFKPAEVAFVKEVTSTTQAKFVYGRVFEPDDNLALSNVPATSVVGVLKGSLDGLHRFTAGDILFQFNSDNVGRYKSYQIGPGTEVGADCIAIGKNIYNKDASTIKIGYDDPILDVRPSGIVVAGNISASDNISTSTLLVASNSTLEGDLTVAQGANTPALKVDLSNNQVGINKAIPNQALDVEGNIAASGSVTGATLAGTITTNAQTNITRVGTLTQLDCDGDITSDGDLKVGTPQSYLTTLHVDTTNKRVGVGRSVPASVLHATEEGPNDFGEGVSYPFRIQNDTNKGYSGVGIDFTITTNDYYSNARIRAENEVASAGTGKLLFQTRIDASNNLTDRLVIDPYGKIGIGETTPERLVHIKSVANDYTGQHPLRVENATTSTSENTGTLHSIIEIKAGDDESISGIDFADQTAETGANDSHPGSIAYAHVDNTMTFDTNDSTRMTIDSSGNVDITGTVTAGAFVGPVVGSIYPIYAEESGDIGDATQEWSFGNGAATAQAHGIPIGFKSKLLKIGVNVHLNGGPTTEDVEVEVYKNGVATGVKGIVDAGLSGADAKKSQMTDVSSSNIVFNENDIINFRTILDGNIPIFGSRVVAWLQTIV